MAQWCGFGTNGDGRMSGASLLDQVTIVSVVSPASGTGRTSAVVNIAWILASAGKRVLIADLDPERPSTRGYLQPFHVESRPAGDCIGEAAAAELSRLVAASWGDPGLGIDPFSLEMRRYRLAGEDVGLELVELPNLAPAGQEREGDRLSELKAAVQQLGYHYVLVDHPTNASDAAMTRIALLSDVVVVCFRLLPSHLPEAHHLAEGIRRGSADTVRVIAAPAQVQPPDGPRTDRPMNLVRSAFAKEPTGESRGGIPIVEIPYHPYGHRAPLAVLADQPGEAGLLRTYERLASEITEGEVSGMAPIPTAVRTRYRQGLGLEPAERAEIITMVYEAHDRRWADWIQNQFERVGVVVKCLDQRGELPRTIEGTVVAVISPRFSTSRARVWLTQLARPASGGPPTDLVGVQVAGGVSEKLPDTVHVLDISAFEEPRARAELLSYFGFVHSSTKPLFPPGFPGVGAPAPRFSNLLPRNPEFVGRIEDLQRLRDKLLAGQNGRCMLGGEAGTGKSEIAREYAHYFALDYDIVWWVQARHRQQVRECLAKLADELAIDVAGDAAASVVKALSHDHRRWLLVYDNADDPDALNGLVPQGGLGHIIITSRSAACATPWPMAETTPLTPADAVALLRNQVPGLNDQDASRVCTKAEHLPIALHLAAAWLREACGVLRAKGTSMTESAAWASREFLVRHEREATWWQTIHSSEMPPLSTAAGLSVSVRELEKSQHGRLAVRLAELCAFLSPDGVGLATLCSSAMLGQLELAGATDGEVIAQDSAELHLVLRSGARYGLFDVNWGRGATVHMHWIVQHLVRASMNPTDRQHRQQQVLRGLAGYAPTDAEGSALARGANYVELAKHLIPSGALDSQDREVRRWVVQQIRFAYREGDAEVWRSTARLGEHLLERWTQHFGADDDLRLRLAVQVANLYRALGRNAAALQLDEHVLVAQRRAFGLLHPRTLITGRGRAGDLRGLGRFREALADDQATWAGFRDIYGPDHPDTLMAAHNLALSSFLVGDVEDALRRGRDTVERRHRLFGADPLLCNSVINIGICLRDLGHFDEAKKEFDAALGYLKELRRRGYQEELRVRKDIAITRRLTGDPGTALRGNTDVLRGYQSMLGEDHPETQACMMSLAADNHEVGQITKAVELATRCLQWYLHELATDHPFSHVCQINLAVFQRSAGDIDVALAAGAAALESLRDQLGKTHPWALGAALNHAGHLAADGQLRQALAVEESTYRLCRDILGPVHPYTQAANRNVLLTSALIAGQNARNKRVNIHLEVPLT
jgi:tetratricopeptide (TPR) repeat protein